jgi:hypothetical protein
MYIPRSPAPGDRNAEDVKVGPQQIPVPWLIPLCIFAPFFLTFILWVLYRCTIKRYKDKKAIKNQARPSVVSEDVELQVRDFLAQPPQVHVPGSNHAAQNARRTVARSSARFSK